MVSIRCLTALGSSCPQGDSPNAGGRSKSQQVKISPAVMMLFPFIDLRGSLKQEDLKNPEKKCRTSYNVSLAAGLVGHKSPVGCGTCGSHPADGVTDLGFAELCAKAIANIQKLF